MLASRRILVQLRKIGVQGTRFGYGGYAGAGLNGQSQCVVVHI